MRVNTSAGWIAGALLTVATLVASALPDGVRSAPEPAAGTAPAYTTVCPVAGSGGPGPSTIVSGQPALNAHFRLPSSVTVDAAGNAFVYVGLPGRIFRIDAITGIATLVAGGGAVFGPERDGPALDAMLDVSQMEVNDAGTVLYFTQGYIVRKVDLVAGTISTIAGVFAESGTPTSGTAIGTPMGSDLVGIALVGAKLYFSKLYSERLYELDLATGLFATVVGSDTPIYGVDSPETITTGVPGPQLSATQIWDLTSDPTGRLYFQNAYGWTVRYDPSTGLAQSIAGSGYAAGDSGDGGPGASAQFGGTVSLAGTTAGLVIGSTATNRLRLLDGANNVNALTGSRQAGLVDGLPAVTRFGMIADIDADADGNVYIADARNHRVRKYSAATGIVSTIAGNGPIVAPASYTGVSALDLPMTVVGGVARDDIGGTYFADSSARRILYSDASGGVTSIAGTGVNRLQGEPFTDGQPAASHSFGASTYNRISVGNLLYEPNFAGQRFLYALESVSQLVRIALDQPGQPVTAITGGVVGPTVGVNANTTIFAVGDYAVAANGDLLIGDTAGRIWRVARATNVLSVFAGDGLIPNTPTGINGPAVSASFGGITAIATAPDGSVYFAAKASGDDGTRLYRVGADGVLRHIAGSGAIDSIGDAEGAALGIGMSSRDLAIDASGRVFSAEGLSYLSNTIRVFDPATGRVGVIMKSPTTPIDTNRQTGAQAQPVTDAVAGTIQQIAIGGDGRLVFADSTAIDFGDTPGSAVYAEYPAQLRVRMLSADGCSMVPAAQVVTVNLAEADKVNATSVPAANIPASAVAAAASTALQSLPMRAVDLVASPMRAVPMRAVPMRAVGFPPIPLSTTPRTDGKRWETVLAGTRYDGVPTQNLTLQDVVTLADELIAAGTAPTELRPENFTLASIDISASPMRAVSLASLALGSTPMRAVVFTERPAVEPFAAYCNARAVAGGFACSGAAGDAPLISAELQGIPMRAVPMRAVPMRAVDLSASPMRAVPMRAVDLSVSPMRAVPMRAVMVTASPMRAVPMRAVLLAGSPMRAVPMRAVNNANTVVDCARVDCATDVGNTATLQTALDNNALRPSVTLGQMFDLLAGTEADRLVLGDIASFVNAAGTDITIGDVQPYLPDTISLADVLVSLVPRSSLPWEDIPLDELGLSGLGAGPRLPVAVDFTLYANRPAASTRAVMNLPAGWALVPGSLALDAVPIADPATRTGPLTIPIPMSTSAGRHRLSLSAAPSAVGSNQLITAKLIDEIAGSPPAVPSVVAKVSTIDDPILAGVARPTLTDGDLILGTLQSGEIDTYEVIVPTTPGTITTVTLSQLSFDADMVAYNPTTRAPVSGRGFRDADLQVAPAESTDPELAPFSSALDPQAAADVPIDAAAPNGVAAISARRGTSTERIELVAKPGDNGVYRFTVSGYNGASGPNPYLITVRSPRPAGAGTCGVTMPTGAATPGAGIAAIGSDRKTLFVVNEQRLRNRFGNAPVDTLMGRLATLAARPEVAGVVLRVDSDAAVRASYSAWDVSPCSTQLANNVVSAINTLVDAKLAAAAPKAQLTSVVIVGSDEMVPMARLADNTRTENEAAYAADVTTSTGDASPLSAALAARNLLTDDVYGDFDPIAWRDTVLFVPDLALGRLVETPDEMVRSIDPYLANNRLAASTATVAGYDFLTDGSVAVDNALGSRIPAGSRTTLINDTWDRAALLTQMYPSGGPSPQVQALNAHFDHHKALPAKGNSTGDRSDLVTSADVAARPGRLTGRLVFSMGCHSGLSVPDGYIGGTGSADRKLDWAEAFANDGAVYIGNTGFGYGDSKTIAFSERLQVLLAQRLNGRYTAGQALAFAKQEYFATLAAYSDYDHKAMMGLTFYGLPFFGVGAVAAPPTPDPKLPTVLDPATGNVPSSPATFGPTFATLGPPGATFLVADGELPQVTEGQPIQPRLDRDVTPTDAGLVAHGALITGLASRDTAGFRPAIADPIVDLAANEKTTVPADAAFPSQLQNVTTYTAPDGKRQMLSLVAGQFVGNPATPGAGVQREFTSISTQVLYAPIANRDYTPPVFRKASAVANGSAVQFEASVSDPQSTVVRVLVVYRDGAVWRTADLRPGPGGADRWVGSGTATSVEVDYFMQAVDPAGNVAVTSDKATLYQTPVTPTPQNFAPTVLAGPDVTATANAPVAITGTFVDPDSTAWTATINDGAGARPLALQGRTFATSVIFTSPGNKSVTVTVCDAANACATDIVVVTVQPAPTIVVAADMGVPGLQTIGFQPIKVSSKLTVNWAIVTGTYASTATGPTTVSVRWGAGESFIPVLFKDSTRFVAAGLFPRSGVRTITVKVCTANGQCGADDLTIDTGVTAQVTPKLECVRDNGTGVSPRYTARFGYANAAAIAVYVPTLTQLQTQLPGVTAPAEISALLSRFSDNKFTSSPAYRGQQQVFLPGRQINTFQTSFASGSHPWTLNGRTVTASSSTARC